MSIDKDIPRGWPPWQQESDYFTPRTFRGVPITTDDDFGKTSIGSMFAARGFKFG